MLVLWKSQSFDNKKYVSTNNLQVGSPVGSFSQIHSWGLYLENDKGICYCRSAENSPYERQVVIL